MISTLESAGTRRALDTKHAIVPRTSTGSGMGDFTVAHCSCGWHSAPFYGYDDYQSSNLREAEQAHQGGAA
jgi:hypothetical protein